MDIWVVLLWSWKCASKLSFFLFFLSLKRHYADQTTFGLHCGYTECQPREVLGSGWVYEFIAWMPIWALQTLQVGVASGKGNHFSGERLQVSTAWRFFAFEVVKSPSPEVTKPWYRKIFRWVKRGAAQPLKLISTDFKGPQSLIMGWAPLAAERELRNTPTLSTSRSLIHFTVKRHLPRLDRVRNTFPQNIPKASHHWDLRSNAIHPFREALLCSPPPTHHRSSTSWFLQNRSHDEIKLHIFFLCLLWILWLFPAGKPSEGRDWPPGPPLSSQLGTQRESSKQ